MPRDYAAFLVVWMRHLLAPRGVALTVGWHNTHTHFAPSVQESSAYVAGGSALAFLAYRMYQRVQREAALGPVLEPEDTKPKEKSLGDILELDDIHIEFAPDLVNMVLDPGTGLDPRISKMRNHVAAVFGLILPEIRLTDHPGLPIGTYVLRIQGVEQARAQLNPDQILALAPEDRSVLPEGTDTREPVYGAPARWINTRDQEEAALAGVTLVTPTEILATHLLEVVKLNFSRLLTLKSLRRILGEMVNISNPARAEANRKLLDELIPDKVPVDALHAVLRLLLDEQVSIRNMPLILEAVAEARGQNAQPEAIVEHVRQRLGFQLVAEMRRADGTLPLIQLAPEWEDTFATYQVDGDRGLDIALPPDLFNRLADRASQKLSDAARDGIHAALVTNTRRRRFLRTVMRAKGISNPVLSFEEIGLDARPSLVGVVAA